uniref:Uncharacterized protein n=1 Tax=viral metagenome TaxID=1070528 RepID=A0A6M3M6I9_9ZZZZ
MRKRVLRRGRYVFLTQCDRCGEWIEDPARVRDVKGRWLELCDKCKGTVNGEVEQMMPPESRTRRKRETRRRPRLAPWERP